VNDSYRRRSSTIFLQYSFPNSQRFYITYGWIPEINPFQ
jgi:hypothetical protein